MQPPYSKVVPILASISFKGPYWGSLLKSFEAQAARNPRAWSAAVALAEDWGSGFRNEGLGLRV